MRSSALALLALALAGCVEVEGFDPVGSQAAIEGRWRIDRMDPTGERCTALGAERVRVTFLDDLRPITHSALFFQCRLGDFDTNDVRGAGAVVGAGTWTVRLDAVDGSGRIVAIGPRSMPITVTATDGGPSPPIVVPTADFSSATLSARFTVGGMGATAARCDERGIVEVDLAFDEWSPAPGPEPTPAPEAEVCAVGFVGARVPPGHYVVRVRATVRSPDAGVVSFIESGPYSYDVAAGQHVAIDAEHPIDF